MRGAQSRRGTRQQLLQRENPMPLTGGLSPQVANEILSFFRRCIEDLSQRVGGPDAEVRAFQVIATLEGGMMLARAYQDTTAFDHAAAGLYRDSEVPAEMSRRKLRDAR